MKKIETTETEQKKKQNTDNEKKEEQELLAEHETYMTQAIKLAKKAYIQGDVPIGWKNVRCM